MHLAKLIWNPYANYTEADTQCGCLRVIVSSVNNATAFLMLAFAFAQASRAQDSIVFQDARKRFAFTYPSSFGATSPGTNDGFEDRVSAVRFATFSAGVHDKEIILGGEAVLTAGFPLVDLQAAGGLYDPITLEIFPAAMRGLILKSLPRLTPANFCDAIKREQHLDPSAPALASINAQQRGAIPNVDRMGNAAPEVVACDVSGNTVSFHKKNSFLPGYAPRHIYGAIQFLPPPYSSFQLIRGGAGEPAKALLQQMEAIVKSWRAGN